MTRLSDLSPRQPTAVRYFQGALGGARRHHAYLLTGSRAHRRRELALAAAAFLVCPQRSAQDACGQCPACQKVASNQHPDVLELVPSDARRITVDAVRELIARLSLRPVEAPLHVVCVAEADRMNPAAQNALLKTLEEPPGAACFFLGGPHRRALLPTIRSRCQRVALAPPSPEGAIAAWQEAGYDEVTSQACAALYGDDVGALALGADDLARVRELIWQGEWRANPGALLDLCAELGADAARFDAALAMLELLGRDALARNHGGGAWVSVEAPAGLSWAAALVDATRVARAQRVFNPNRALMLERVLMVATERTA